MAFADATAIVAADFSRFQREFGPGLRRAVTRVLPSIVRIFRTAGTTAGRAFVDAFTEQLDRALPAARRIGKLIGRTFAIAAAEQTRNVPVDFRIPATRATALGKQFREAITKQTQRIPVSFASNPNARAIGRLTGQRFRAGAMEFTLNIPFSFNSKRTVAEGVAAGQRFRRAAESRTSDIEARITTIGGDESASIFNRLLAPLRALNVLIPPITNKFFLLGSAALLAAGPASALIGSLLPLAGIAAALPAAMAVFSASLITLGFAMKSIGQVVDKSLVPAFLGLDKAVGAVATRGLSTELQKVGANLAGPVRQGALNAASGLNALLLSIARFAQQRETANVFKASFDAAGASFRNLSTQLPTFLAGFRDLAGVVLPLFVDLSAVISSVIGNLGEFLTRISNNGQAVAWIETAVDVLVQLGAIVINLGTIFVRIFSAAEAAGGGILQRIVELTNQFATFLGSAEGTAVLTSIFTALNQVTAAVTPVIGALLSALSKLLPVILTALAPLLPVISDLAVSLINALLPALLSLAPLLDGLVKGLVGLLAPLGPVLGQLGSVLAGVLGPLAERLGAILAELGPPLGQLAAALLQALIPALTAIGPIFISVLDSLQPLIPSIIELIPAVSELVISLAPLLTLVTQLIVLFIQVQEPLVRLLAQFASFLIVKSIVPQLKAFADGFNALAGPILKAVDLVKEFGSFITSFDFTNPGKSIEGGFGGAFDAVTEKLLGFSEDMRNFFTGIAGNVGSWLADLPGVISDAFTSAINATLTAIGAAIGSIFTFFVRLPGRIRAALLALPGILATFFTNAISFAFEALGRAVGAIITFFVQLPGRIIRAVLGLRETLATFFANVVSFAFEALSRGVGLVIAFFIALPGRIVSAVSSLRTTLVEFFATVVSFVFETVSRNIGNLIAFFFALPGRIISAVISIRETLATFFSNLWESIQVITSAAVTRLLAFLSSLPGRIGAAVASLRTTLGTFFTNLWNSITSTASRGVDSLVGFFQSLPGRLKALGPQLLAAGKALLTQLMNGLIGVAGNIGDFASRLVNAIKRFINDNVIGAIERGLNDSLPFDIHLKRLAKGEFLREPTVALLAEAGPEVVIPLSNPARARELAAESGLDRILNSGTAQPIVNIRVFLGTREISDVVRVEIDDALDEQASQLTTGTRGVI